MEVPLKIIANICCVCGKEYPIGKEGSDDYLCSQECIQAYEAWYSETMRDIEVIIND